MEKAKRECGDCSMCCYIYEVPAYKKESRLNCIHLGDCGYGCKIHDKDRHPICTEYLCGWMRGEVDDEFKPNKCGVIIDVENYYGDGRAIFISEEKKGNHKKKDIIDYINWRMRERDIVIVTCGQKDVTYYYDDTQYSDNDVRQIISMREMFQRIPLYKQPRPMSDYEKHYQMGNNAYRKVISQMLGR